MEIKGMKVRVSEGYSIIVLPFTPKEEDEPWEAQMRFDNDDHCAENFVNFSDETQLDQLINALLWARRTHLLLEPTRKSMKAEIGLKRLIVDEDSFGQFTITGLTFEELRNIQSAILLSGLKEKGMLSSLVSQISNCVIERIKLTKLMMRTSSPNK